MRTIKLTIAYDGTDFAGWQRQLRDRTVQAVIEDALAPIEGAQVAIVGAGRTDAGVHAAGQVASFASQSAIARESLQRALNTSLPADVRIVAADDVAGAFNARFNAKAKTYHYWIWNGSVVPPVLRRFVWQVEQPLAVEPMQEAARLLIGAHDFAAFQGAGSDVKTTTRAVTVSQISEVPAVGPFEVSTPGRLLRYEIAGSGFLRHMVRAVAGTLVEAGRGRWPPTQVGRILASRDRGQAGPTAPAHGLVFWKVDY
jgi:tRNA pseudouridine38-40 synthase